MPYSTAYTPPNKILPKLVAMTPYQVYLNQITSMIEPIRIANVDSTRTYIPPQFGGLEGQRGLVEEAVILELITFEIQA